MKIFRIFFVVQLFIYIQCAVAMETLPNEVQRMMLAHLNSKQRRSVERVAKRWWFLSSSLVPKKELSEPFMPKGLRFIDNNHMWRTADSTMSRANNQHIIIWDILDQFMHKEIENVSRIGLMYKTWNVEKIMERLPKRMDLDHTKRIVSISLGENKGSIKDVIEKIYEYPQITDLRLNLSRVASNSCIQHKAINIGQMKKVVEALGNNKTIDSLHIANWKKDEVTNFALLANDLLRGDETIKRFSCNKKLQSLTDAEVGILADVIVSNRTLISIDLSCNGITDSHARNLIDAFAINQNPNRTLDLTNNNRITPHFIQECTDKRVLFDPPGLSEFSVCVISYILRAWIFTFAVYAVLT